VPVDLETIADPRLILLGWAAGLTLVGGGVSLARIVGPGFIWVIAGFGGVVGLGAWAVEGTLWSRISLGLVVLALIGARQRSFAAAALITAAAGYLIDAVAMGGWLLATTLTLALGGVTGEMALGHWYLVDPRLPRSALRALAVVGVIGLVADGAALVSVGDFERSGPVIAFIALLGTSVVLMVAVLGALRYPAYSGVMAATGLSYLAVLTTLGAVFLGRALAGGIGPFTS
jgi:hypothetical protein